ncbi:MAG TPA: hypothetical protein VIP98_24215 [Microlunatus sp.]
MGGEPASADRANPGRLGGDGPDEDSSGTGTSVHVHVPVTLTITGTPSPDDLDRLEDVLRERLAQALDSARRQADARLLAATHRQARTPAPIRRAPAVRRRVPLWQPRTGPLIVGRDWRVLRAVTIPVSIRAFLVAVRLVNGAGIDPIPDLVRQELIERLAGRRLSATIWLVETLRSTTLDALEQAVNDRYLELAHAQNSLYAISPADGDRRLLAELDPTGAVAGLPSLEHVNARRSPGGGELLHGARVVFAAVPVPRIDVADVVTTGGLVRRLLTLSEVEPFIDRSAFEQRYLRWDRYAAELANRTITVGLVGGVVHPPFSAETAAAAMLAEVESQLPPDPLLNRVRRVYRAEDPDLPAAAQQLAVGQQLVVAVLDLPLDNDTITAARERPDARTRAAQIRNRLTTDPTTFHWGWDLYHWLRDYYGEPPESRPDGGTAFEYVADELVASGDLDRLLDAADRSGEELLRFWLLRQLQAAGFGNRSRVQQLRMSLTRLRESRWANRYQPATGELWLDGDHRVKAGTDDAAVLAEALSIYVVTAKSQQLKAAAADRIRALVPKIAIDTLREINTAGAATTYTPDSFGQEVFRRVAEQAKLTADDLESVEIRRSWRLEAIRPIEQWGVPSYLLVLRAVEKRPGGSWTPVGDTFEQTAGDFEANLTYWALGSSAKVYQTMGLIVTGIGLIAVAWEVGVIAFLIDAAGGGTALLISITASELLYFAKVLLGKAELTWEGFFLAAADGYIAAVGFRLGALGAAPIAKIIGTGTVTRVWTGLVLERLAAGAVGGGLSAVGETFVHDLVRVAFHDGQLSGWQTYVRNLGIGAAVGALGELTLRPVLTRLGRSAATTAKDIIDQLKAEGVSLATFTTMATAALSRLRTVVSGLVGSAEAGGLYTAFEDHLIKIIDQWAPTTVARRVLELQGVVLTPAAEQGVARLAWLTETPLDQEAIRRLTAELSAHPSPAVSFLEVLGRLEPSAARRLVSGTFGSDADLAAFVGRLAGYSAAEQRAAVQLLADAELLARPPGAGDSAALLDRQLERALALQARAQQIEAEELLARAQAEAARGRADRAARMQERAEAQQTQATALEEQAAGTTPGVGRRALPDIAGDPEAAAAFEKAFGGPGGEGATLSVGTHYRLPARPDWEPAAADIRMMFSSRSGNPVVFRVQGGSTPPAVSKQVFAVDPSGRVTIPGGASDDVFVNVGSLERAIEWLVEKRPGGSLVVFEVDAAWLKAFRGIARPEQAASASGLPYTVDVRYAADQVAIPPSLLGEFEEFIVQGTGRVLTFTPTGR